MRKATVRGQGFTLIEVLVTIAIVGTLAAVLAPALINQLSKGDAGRTTSDLVAVQTAIGAFTSDTRRYPATLLQLKTVPANSASDILGNQFGDVLIKKWRGPYLSKEVNGSNAMPTGSGATISAAFGKATYNDISYLTITAGPFTLNEFNNIDQIIDEAASSTSGQLTLSGTTATFAAVPIQ